MVTSTIELKDLIKRVREALSMTQPEFANKLEVHPITVSRWERGENVPRERDLKAILRIIKNKHLDKKDPSLFAITYKFLSKYINSQNPSDS